MNLPRSNGDGLASMQHPFLVRKAHAYCPLEHKKSFMLNFMVVARAGLVGENEEIFSAVAGGHLIGDPQFCQAGAVKIIGAEILKQRLGRGRKNSPAR